MDPQLAKLLSDFANGMSEDEVIAKMKCQQFSIVKASKAMRELFGLSLAEAKQRVASHPDYRELALASETLHDEAIQAFQEIAIKQEDVS